MSAKLDANFLPDFLNILPGRIGLVFADLRIRVGHQGMVAGDGFESGQADCGALDTAGKSGELVRFDVAYHDFEIRLDVSPVAQTGVPRDVSPRFIRRSIIFRVMRNDPVAR